MKRKSVFKRLLAASLAAALVVSAAATANAEDLLSEAPVEDEESKIVEEILPEEYSKTVKELSQKSMNETRYSSTYQAYLDGKIHVDTTSGVMVSPYVASGSRLTPSADLPSSYKSDTTPIRDQGIYSTCWAFTAIGALESLLSKEGRGYFDLSESHLAWWTTPTYNSNGYGWLHNGFQLGGFSIIGGGYFLSWQGPKLESDIPYSPYDYYPSLPGNMNTAKTPYNVTEAMYLEKDKNTIKEAIYRYGAVATSFNALDEGFNSNYSAFYLKNTADESDEFSGHAVTVIGWDDNYSRDNFNSSNRPSSNGAWLVKNSWGTEYGDEGYLWISYEDAYAFDTNVWGPNIAYTSVRTARSYDKICQDEKYGAINDIGFTGSMTFVNVLDFDSAHPYLDSIIFETQSAGSSYKAYYIPVSNDTPASSGWTELASGTIANNGYVKLNLIEKGITVPSGKGAIGISIDGSSIENGASLGTCEWLTMDGYTYAFRPETAKNQSFLYYQGEYTDLVDLYRYKYGDSDDGATFVIKAITTSQVIGDINGDFKSNTADAILILRQIAGLEKFNNSGTINADVNFDGKIDVLDAVNVQRKSAKLISEY